LPTFEVLLNAPQQVPLDGQFSVGLVARYFAGGLVADRPIKWRVTQFPHEWSPPGREGFLFSSDARFSREREFRSTPVRERDADGKPLAGVAMTVRLIHRNWNSVLQASDFSQGSAKYVTQVIDDTVAERQVASSDDVQHLHFDAREAGVYIVELEAADRIGRK